MLGQDAKSKKAKFALVDVPEEFKQKPQPKQGQKQQGQGQSSDGQEGEGQEGAEGEGQEGSGSSGKPSKSSKNSKGSSKDEKSEEGDDAEADKQDNGGPKQTESPDLDEVNDNGQTNSNNEKSYNATQSLEESSTPQSSEDSSKEEQEEDESESGAEEDSSDTDDNGNSGSDADDDKNDDTGNSDSNDSGDDTTSSDETGEDENESSSSKNEVGDEEDQPNEESESESEGTDGESEETEESEVEGEEEANAESTSKTIEELRASLNPEGDTEYEELSFEERNDPDGQLDLSKFKGAGGYGPTILPPDNVWLNSNVAHFRAMQERFSLKNRKQRYETFIRSYAEEEKEGIVRAAREHDFNWHRHLISRTFSNMLSTDFLTRREIENLIGSNLNQFFRRTHKPAKEDVTFAAKLRNVMRDNKFDRKVSARKQGTLDGNMLYKVPTRDRKVFSQKVAHQNKDYNIAMIIDQSGSMTNNENYEKAAHMAASLAKAFEQSGIAYSCYGYNHRTIPYKRYGDNITPDALYGMLSWASGDNNEYPVVVDAYMSFQKKDKRHNYVILLSDGHWASEQKESVEKWLKKHKNQATFIGIGIGNDRMPMPFADVDIQTDTLAEAKTKLLIELRKAVTRG
jgi:hypothetical protein